MRYRIFISSVQREFAEERKALAAMIRKDKWLSSFFEVFVFEEGSAKSRSAQKVYLDAVADADIYLGIIGDKYGNADAEGVSPTEREFDKATELNKDRLVFVRKNAAKRDKPEAAFLAKVGEAVTWKQFTTAANLKKVVYDALFDWLQENDLVTNKPFDKSCSRKVKLSDIDEEKFSHYVELVNRRKKVTLEPDVSVATVLEKIGAKERNSDRITNGALPLFARRPDEYKISWEIRCSHYYGFDAVKPIPVLKTYNGTVFDLVDQALEFVMSRVDFEIGSRVGTNASAPTKPEFPEDAVQEALVNAVCHRDYTSNACVQVMLFRDRLEIINPGTLPKGTTKEDLYRQHDSNPRNEVIAQAMSWTSYVEKSGNGTREIIRKCIEHGLAEPTFEPRAGFFHIILWRKGYGPNGKLGAPQGTVKGHSQRAQSKGPVGTKSALSRGPVGTKSGPSRWTKSKGSCGAHEGPMTMVQGRKGTVRGHSQRAQSEGTVEGHSQIAIRVGEILSMLARNELGRKTIAESIHIPNKSGYLNRMLVALLEDGLIEWTIPDKPNSRLQKYRLTEKGRAVIAQGTRR